MIDICYCPDTGVDHATEKVVAAAPAQADPDLQISATHHHADETDHVCSAVLQVDEVMPRQYPWTCLDGVTVVNDADEWLVHLEQYVP